MNFIGVIIEAKRGKYINKIFSNNLNGKDKVILIHKDNINNMRNIKFETILILNNNDEIFQKNEILKFIVSNTKYIIINSDMKNNLNLLNNLNVNVITYGFNSKASITASSVTDEEIILCIQRKLKIINGKIIENQEIKVNLWKNITTNEIMGIVSLFLIYDKKFKI